MTDTIPLQAGVDDGKVTVLSIAPLFGEAISASIAARAWAPSSRRRSSMVEEMTFWSEDAESDDGPEAIDRPAPDDAPDGEREPFRVGAG